MADTILQKIYSKKHIPRNWSSIFKKLLPLITKYPFRNMTVVIMPTLSFLYPAKFLQYSQRFFPAPWTSGTSSNLSASLSLSLSFFFFLTSWHVGFQFSGQGSNPCPLHRECRVLTTGSPGKSCEHLSWIFTLWTELNNPEQDTEELSGHGMWPVASKAVWAFFGDHTTPSATTLEMSDNELLYSETWDFTYSLTHDLHFL